MHGDLYGGVTAGVVALPLALAFGEASGAGPIAGLWGAIIVGLFASLFGGTDSQVSGPTGPMIVVFAGVFGSLHGDLSLVFAAVVLAGLFQILFGFLKPGQYIRLVPFGVGEPHTTTPEERSLLDQVEDRVFVFEFGGPLSFGAAQISVITSETACRWERAL
jgi:MFS superfamily sulfate permease-like transporter